MKKSAIKSPDKKYRYCLKRDWDEALPTIVFIGLNPSLADAINNDATINKCIKYAMRWGYGSLVMLNLFAYITVDPKVLLTVNDPIGKQNNRWLKKYRHHTVLACWGNHGYYRNRDLEVMRWFPKLYCLAKTKSGRPMHPLYLSKKLKPKIFKKESRDAYLRKLYGNGARGRA